MSRLVCAAVLFAAGVSVRADDRFEAAKEKQAELSAFAIRQACAAYHLTPANATGDFPSALVDLVKPPFGGPSFLKDGAKDLLDPWGKQYKFTVAKDEKGEERAYVWTERTVDGKMKVLGTKPPEKKK
jgi:hypothetical protein